MRRVVSLLLLPALALLAGGFAWPPTAAAYDDVVVIKPLGAPLYNLPFLDAEVVAMAACNERLPVVAAGDGWYQVSARARLLWVPAARVAEVSAAPEPDCTDAVTFQPFQAVMVSIPDGCLSLRRVPSQGAPFTFCVNSGHAYFLIGGPVEVDGEDWIQLWSAATGTGWSLARYLAAP